MDQKLADVTVAPFGNLAKALLTTTRSLLGNKSKPRRQLSSGCELCCIHDTRCKSACGNRAYPRYRRQTAAHLVRPVPGKKLTLDGPHTLSNITQLIGQHAKHLLGKDRQLLASNRKKLK